MLNVELCEQRGEGGEHSKALRVGLGSESTALAIPKEWTTPGSSLQAASSGEVLQATWLPAANH